MLEYGEVLWAGMGEGEMEAKEELGLCIRGASNEKVRRES